MDQTQAAVSTRITPSASLSPAAFRIAGAIAGSLLVAICAHVSVPLLFTPVPLTLQTFAVLLLGLTLGPATAFAALALYLVQGAAGLPVFSPHGPGGILQLMGPTGGTFSLSFCGSSHQPDGPPHPPRILYLLRLLGGHRQSAHFRCRSLLVRDHYASASEYNA